MSGPFIGSCNNLLPSRPFINYSEGLNVRGDLLLTPKELHLPRTNHIKMDSVKTRDVLEVFDEGNLTIFFTSCDFTLLIDRTFDNMAVDILNSTRPIKMLSQSG